jgi:PAS domain S-box-containing protein
MKANHHNNSHNEKKSILIVEDAYSTYLFLQVLLEENGYHVFKCISAGEDVYGFVKENRPDFILMDILLEREMDGISAAKQVLKDFDIPIIYISANTDEDNLNNAANTAPYGFIVKPINEKELLTVIKTAEQRFKLKMDLIEKERKYRSLFENMHDAFVYLKLEPGEFPDQNDFVILEVNEAFKKLFHTRAADILGRNIMEVYPEIETIYPGWRKVFSDVAKFSKSLKISIFLKNIKRWFNFSLYCPKRDFLSIVIEDITERKQIENSLRENEEKFRSITTAANDAIVMMDDEGLVKFWNRSAEKIFGYREDEVIGRSLHTFIIPEGDMKGHLDGLEKWKASGKGNIIGKTTTMPAVRKDGQGLFVELSLSSVILKERWNVMAIIRDITDRKETEERLNEAHNEIKSLLQSIDSLIIGVSLNDRITHWNNVSEKLFDLKSENSVGLKMADLPIKWEWDRIFEGISSSIINNEPVMAADIKYESRDRVERYLDISINPTIDTDGVLNGFILYGNDITDRKTMHMQLIQDQKLKSIGELASGIAHEIKTPTQYINDNTIFLNETFDKVKYLYDEVKDMIKRSHRNNPGSEELLKLENIIKEKELDYLMEEYPVAINQSMEGISRISKIVNSMKSFSHPGIEKKVPQDLNKAINDTITISRNEWKYNSDVETDLDEHIKEIYCYPAELNQVLLNIIVNASQAINEAIDNKSIKRGKIDISTKMINGKIEISIKDNGPGIPEEIREKIFTPFFTTKEIGKGTGQGLAIAQSVVVAKHRGKISVKSEPGKWTEFVITLPSGN